MKAQLRYYRQQNGLETEDVAFMLGIPVADYVDIENGVAELPLKLLVKLCRFYGLKTDDLLPPVPPERSYQERAQPKISSKKTSTREWVSDPDHHRKKMTPKEAMAIFEKHGNPITEEDAGKVLDFMDKMVRLAMDQYHREAKWEAELQDHPEGFVFDESGYGCRICGSGTKEGWYDRFGLKCQLCQKAVDQGIIPGEVTRDATLYYNEYELERDFNLAGKALTEWLRQGILKARTITGSNGRSRHYRIFLLEDNAAFLPPKAMLECHESVEIERNGETWQRPLRWYQCQDDPAGYIKAYGIARYLKFTKPEQ